VVTLDPGVGVEAEALADAWSAGLEAESAGPAEVEPAGPGSSCRGWWSLLFMSGCGVWWAPVGNPDTNRPRRPLYGFVWS
jgi:hypothetical protein